MQHKTATLVAAHCNTDRCGTVCIKSVPVDSSSDLGLSTDSFESINDSQWLLIWPKIYAGVQKDVFNNDCRIWHAVIE